MKVSPTWKPGKLPTSAVPEAREKNISIPQSQPPKPKSDRLPPASEAAEQARRDAEEYAAKRNQRKRR